MKEKTISQCVRDMADELLRTKGTAHPLEVREMVKARHPELVDHYVEQLRDQRLLDMARNALRPSADKQEELPGFGSLPSTFTVPDGEGDVRYVALRHATLDDEAADLEVKRANVEAVQAQFAEAEARHKRLWSVRGADGSMSVLDAVKRLANA